MTEPEMLGKPPEFSLVSGGPLFHFFHRAHLSGQEMELLRRRVIADRGSGVATIIVSSIDRRECPGWTTPDSIPLRYRGARSFSGGVADFDHRRSDRAFSSLSIVKRFVERDLILPEDMSKFRVAINSAVRFRNSMSVELGLLILVYTVGLWIWRSQVATGFPSWYAKADGWQLHLPGPFVLSR